MTQIPTILQVIPGLHTGGAERTAVDIANAVVQRGWKSIVASAGGRLLPQLMETGSEHIILPLESKNPFVILSNARRLQTIIEDHNVSIIHARSRAPAWSALIAARRCKIPLVSTYHGAYNQKNRLKALYNSVMARADIVIANSGWTAELIKVRNPTAVPKIRIIHRGTDFQAFKKSKVSKDRLKRLQKDWNVTEDKLLVVKLARVTGWKGQSVVIDAAAILAQTNKPVQFVLAGDAQGRDDYLGGLKRQIISHNLEKQVILPGHCDDPAAAMALADIVIVASTEAEAFGRAAIEAGALEKPVIVSRIGAVVETVLAEPDVDRNDRTGWKVEPGNAQELASALKEVIALSNDERAKIGKRAREHGEKNFSLEQMCEKTMEVYDSLLSN